MVKQQTVPLWDEEFSDFLQAYDQLVCIEAHNEITLVVPLEDLITILQACKQRLCMHVLVDLCGVDYLHFEKAQWVTKEATADGYSRGPDAFEENGAEFRFCCVYHLLSTHYLKRIRVKTFLDDSLCLPSVVDIWPSANWYEREAYDLFGFVFEGHPELVRILTDYAFIGHPFRKDFPVSGHNELRYSEQLGRCVYEPTSVEPRTVIPKVIRTYDNRYARKTNKEDKDV